MIRESFRIQRALTDMGYRVTRYSAIALKVHVEESDGLDRGLDVFGGFMRDGKLYLMGEIAVPFKRSWIYPLGTASLEGREFPVPADTDRFLTATYGPRWRTPDPAYKFTTPASTIELFNGWFRGMRTGRAGWHGYHKRTIDQAVSVSAVAREVAERHPDLATYVDIGCGRGADVAWFADRGTGRGGPGLPAVRLRARGGAACRTTRASPSSSSTSSSCATSWPCRRGWRGCRARARWAASTSSSGSGTGAGSTCCAPPG